MSCNITVPLKVADLAGPFDASVGFTTDAQTISKSYEWSLIFLMNGLDADPNYLIEVSHDGVNFFRYYQTETPIVLTGATDSTTGLVGAQDTYLPFNYFRVVYDPLTVTTGTIMPTWTILKDE